MKLKVYYEHQNNSEEVVEYEGTEEECSRLILDKHNLGVRKTDETFFKQNPIQYLIDKLDMSNGDGCDWVNLIIDLGEKGIIWQ